MGIEGKKTNRQLIGLKTFGVKKIGEETIDQKPSEQIRYYHFGLEAMPLMQPWLALAMKPHVVFTMDGTTPHRDAAFQHRARRGQCKAWWNDRWRDLMLAAMAVISDGASTIELPLCPHEPGVLDSRPIPLESPVSYRDEDVKEPSPELIADADDSEMREEDEDADDARTIAAE